MKRRRGIFVPKLNPINWTKQSMPTTPAPSATVPPQSAPSASPPPKTHHLPPKAPPKNGETSPHPQRTSAFRSMAETAGAVAVGSTIGNVIGTSINTIILYLFGNKDENHHVKRNT